MKTRSIIGTGLAALAVPGFIYGFTNAPAPPAAQLIFVSNRGGIINGTPNGNDIYTMSSNGSGVVRLTNNTSAEWEPHWSPDRTKIAFATNRDGNYQIYIMNANGSGQVNLTNTSSFDFGPAWSPDGTMIAFSSDRDSPGFADVFVMNADGTNPVNLTNNLNSADGHPVWSPDGSKIVFRSRRDGNSEVYVMNADGSDPVNLTNHPADDLEPSWSPDGRIGFSSSREGNQKIYVMNADGSNLRRLTNTSVDDYEPSWSPDGSKIVFYRKISGENTEIYTMNASGKGNPTRVTNNYPYLDSDPDWKP